MAAAAIGLIGVAASIGGTVMGVMGQKKAIAAQKRAEELRKKQMELDSARQRREIARRATVARAQAVSDATAQGAGQSSALQGGIAQVTGDRNRGTLAVNQNTDIGRSIFDANMQRFKGESMMATGQGISAFGGMIGQNQEMFGRVGSYFTGNG